MIQYLKDIWENIQSVFATMGLVDYLDILLLAYLIYKGIKIIKETRAEQLIKGIILLAILFFVVNQFQLKAMKVIIETFLNVGIIAILIVFQPELRRVLEKMGRTTKVKKLALNFESKTDAATADIHNCIEAVCTACEQLSQTATGALIVFERETKLGEQIDTGTIINATPSPELFGNIFFPNTPLHDGAVIIRDGKILDAVCDVGFWLLLITGLVLILMPTEIFASISQMTFVFPEPLNMLAKGMAIVGAVGILLMSGRDKKNHWGLRIALGAYDLYGITSWLSDILSYSRLLALGLATGVIASVFNQKGSMFGSGIIGAILFIIVFVIGHIFNIAINLLGAYVHTCRLQYVEFFGKFYEGGGREFHPFRSNTKYVDVKEETKV